MKLQRHGLEPRKTVKKFADGGKVKPERIEPTMGRLPDLKGSAGEPVLGPVPIIPDPRPEPKVKGYADGGKVNTFRSDAEKQVDKLYGKPADKTQRRKVLDDTIDSADQPAIGGVRG